MHPMPPDPACNSSAPQASPDAPDSAPSPTATTTVLPAWKQDLLRSLYARVAELPDTPPDDADPPADAPTLEDFYKALISLEANTRKNVQKTTAALDSVAKSLRALQLEVSEIEVPASAAEDFDPGLWLTLDGQLRRLCERLRHPPPDAPFGLSRKWRTAWEEIASGTQIIVGSLSRILATQDIRRDAPEPGTVFDPASMEAVKVSADSRTGSGRPPGESMASARVLETIEPAYYQNDKLIRPARAHVRR